MQFEEYTGALITQKRAFKAQGIKIKKDQMYDLTTFVCVTEIMNKSEFNISCVISELVHYSLSNTCFQLSTNITEKFSQSEIKLNIDELKIPIRIFELIFEKGTKIDGIELLPSIIIFCPDKPLIESYELIYKEIQKRIKTQANMMLEDFKERFIKDKVIIFSINNETKELYASMLILDEIQKQGIEHCIKNIKTLDTLARLNQKNKQNRIIMHRIVFSLICYLNTENKDILYGKDESKKLLEKIGTVIKIGSLETKISPKWHLRSGCFHVLKHERFKRKPDGSYNIIWVKPSIINKEKELGYSEQKTKLVEEKNEITRK